MLEINILSYVRMFIQCNSSLNLFNVIHHCNHDYKLYNHNHIILDHTIILSHIFQNLPMYHSLSRSKARDTFRPASEPPKAPPAMKAVAIPTWSRNRCTWHILAHLTLVVLVFFFRNSLYRLFIHVSILSFSILHGYAATCSCLFFSFPLSRFSGTFAPMTRESSLIEVDCDCCRKRSLLNSQSWNQGGKWHRATLKEYI